MLKKTLSTITAIAIVMGTLNADTTKDMKVVPKTAQSSYYSQPEYIEDNGIEEDEYTQEEAYYTPTAREYQEPFPPQEVVKPTQSFNDVIIYARPAKKSYRVNEPIRIQLKLKKRSYIYIWTVGRDGRGYMILPNRFTSYNKFRSYYNYVVPENSSKYEFQADRKGVEHIYILATNKPISSSKMKSIFNQKVGNFPTASAKATKDFTTKDIHVIAKQENIDYDIQHVAITIGKSSKKAHNRPQKSNAHNVNININN